MRINVEGKSGEEIMHEVLERLVSGERFGSASTHSFQETDSFLWGEPESISWFTGGKYIGLKGKMNVDDWIELQFQASSVDTKRDFTLGAYDKTIEQVQENISDGNEDSIPTPVLEVKPREYTSLNEGYIEYKLVQEGRSRGIGARKAGLDELPVYIAVRRPRR